MNEYLRELEEKTKQGPDGWRRFPDYFKTCDPPMRLRKTLCKKYSWAIPNDEAIETLVENDPIIEIGAGNGYWSYLVEQAGGSVITTDIDPPGEDERAWTHIFEADHEFVKAHDQRTLFTCWPSYSADWTAEMLEWYDGDTVIYVGEGRGGCTGNERFHQILDEEFGIADEIVDIPQWEGIRDRMYVFRR